MQQFGQVFQHTNGYNSILYDVVEKKLNTMSDYQKDNIALDISKTLYFHTAKKNLIFYLWKISSFFGDTAFFITFFTFFIGCTVNILMNKKRNPSIYQVFIFISLLTILSNAAFVAIFEPILPFYSLYSYFLIFCLGGLLAKKCIEKNGISNELAA